jgi:iron complex transport system substrate-binding protein
MKGAGIAALPSAMRVVSLLPSATEILCAIGGGGMLVGRSHECDFAPVPMVHGGSVQGVPHPGFSLESVPVLTAARTHFESAAQVDRDVREVLDSRESGSGSLYTLDAELLEQLRPDVILTQDLCHVCSIDLGAVRAIADRLSPRPQIVSLNAETVEGVFDDILTVGHAVGLEAEAGSALVRLRERLYSAGDHVNPYADGPVVAFLEWTDPLFIGGHWTPQLIERAGGTHPLNPTSPLRQAGAAAGPVGTTLRKAGKSVVVPPEVLVATRPQRLIICPCGLDLARVRRETALLAEKPWWRDLPAVHSGQVALVDGNQMFNRPGPRLVDAFEWLVGWLNEVPELIAENFPWEPWRG